MLFSRLKEKLIKTRQRLGAGVRRLFGAGRKFDEELIGEIEETLIGADVGVAAVTEIINDLRARYREGELVDGEAVMEYLRRDMKALLGSGRGELARAAEPPTVVMVTGVNGVGKTTSIAKLAWFLAQQDQKVLLAACDTFRAAAVEQLGVWAERAGVELVRQKSGSDPAAVAFDACEAALARGADVVIVDTAGRLHTQTNLMRELEKIHRVIARKIPGAPHEVLLVLDATTGQNALVQARLFKQAVQVTGVFLAKLDGTAKGGIVVAIDGELDLPVKFIGVGEKPEDIEPFEADSFVEALFE